MLTRSPFDSCILSVRLSVTLEFCKVTVLELKIVVLLLFIVKLALEVRTFRVSTFEAFKEILLKVNARFILEPVYERFFEFDAMRLILDGDILRLILLISIAKPVDTGLEIDVLDVDMEKFILHPRN